MSAIYVEDWVDEELQAWVQEESPSIRLYILTGSAGHGKSAAMARLQQIAEDEGVALETRFDATHSDARDETYREGLRRFLQPFESGEPRPNKRHILAMNLGRALNFFSDPEDLERWSGVAAHFDDGFELGLSPHDDKRNDVKILDLSGRISAELDEESEPVLPFVIELLQRLNPATTRLPVGEAIARECNDCPRADFCPVRFNVAQLNSETFIKNLAHATAAAAVESGIHLTPRKLLDLVSRILIPERFVEMIDPSDAECSLKGISRDRLGEPQEDWNYADWRTHLEDTIYSLAFPADDAASSDAPLLEAIEVADPARIRTQKWDKKRLDWSADVSDLLEDLPTDFVSYLGPTSDEYIDKATLAAFVRAIRWRSYGPSQRAEGGRLHQFLGLSIDPETAGPEWPGDIAEALSRVASDTYHDDGNRQSRTISLDLPGAGSAYRILADLHQLSVSLKKKSDSVPLNNMSFTAVVHVQGSHESRTELEIDWQTFDLLCDVLEGFVPSSGRGAHQLLRRRISEKLAGSSSMTDHVRVESRDIEGHLNLVLKETAKGDQIIETEIR